MQSTDLGVKIGSRIRASRMSIGLTQEQLAEKSRSILVNNK